VLRLKKFILGLSCGVALTATTAVYASNSIQAFLFPAKVVINGETKNPSQSGYEMINYDGHAYVPIRYMAENLGSKVVYDEDSNTITVDDGFNIIDANNLESSAGYVSVTKDGDHSTITGKLYIGHMSWDHKFIDAMQSMNPTVDYSQTKASGTLVFWNDKGEIIEKVPYEMDKVRNATEQIVDLQTKSQKDLTGYAVVTLENTKPSPRPNLSLLDGHPEVKDKEEKLSFGVMNVIKLGEYSLVRGTLYTINGKTVAADAPITITFFDDKGHTLGTAHTKIADKPDVMYSEFIGKGDFTHYDSMSLEVGE
jgi:hypothetical protein